MLRKPIALEKNLPLAQVLVLANFGQKLLAGVQNLASESNIAFDLLLIDGNTRTEVLEENLIIGRRWWHSEKDYTFDELSIVKDLNISTNIVKRG